MPIGEHRWSIVAIDRGFYVVSMMHLREYGSSRPYSGTGRNYPRHRMRKSSLSLADERAKSAKNSPSGHEFFRASEIYFTRPKFLAEDDTRVHTVSRSLFIGNSGNAPEIYAKVTARKCS